MLSIYMYIQQIWKGQLQETMCNYNDKIYFSLCANCSLITYELINQTEQIWFKKKIGEYYKSFVKGTPKRLEKMRN